MSPSGEYFTVPSPNCWAASNRITLPKPLLVGGDTRGPPASFHEKTNASLPLLRSSLPEIETRPLEDDKAPYLTALVASSWTTLANCCGARGERAISQPSPRARLRSS